MKAARLLAIALASSLPLSVGAQVATPALPPAALPSGPASSAPAIPQTSSPASPSIPNSSATSPSATSPVTLTLTQAENMALHNNPRIALERLLALAQNQVTRETRSIEMPALTGNITAVDSHAGSRITAGGLNNPVVYQRAAAGLTLSQLLTDFGRTRNLVGSAELRAQASASAAEATAADIKLAVDQAFYRALGAQSILNVAQETVKARQTNVDQISALTNAKLRSTLDLSFANVALAQAKLLLLNANNQAQDALTSLNALLGEDGAPNFTLVQDEAALPPPPQDPESLVSAAFAHRPDLLSLNQQAQAAKKFSAAEHDLNRPTLSALAAGGGTPVRADAIPSSWYGAVGVNLSIPVFNGFLFSARAQGADLRARASERQVQDLRDAIARDVRTTALQARSNYERISVAQQLLDESNSALDLAQLRYNLGLSSIVELSQAQLQQTQALIDFADARYTYAASLAEIRFQTGQ